jgi:hypothetical protein
MSSYLASRVEADVDPELEAAIESWLETHSDEEILGKILAPIGLRGFIEVWLKSHSAEEIGLRIGICKAVGIGR